MIVRWHLHSRAAHRQGKLGPIDIDALKAGADYALPVEGDLLILQQLLCALYGDREQSPPRCPAAPAGIAVPAHLDPLREHPTVCITSFIQLRG